MRQFPLGDTITGNPHSVCVSLPTRADVVGYEEKNPAVLAALQTGYPRFFEHPLVKRLSAHWAVGQGTGDGFRCLCAGEREAQDLVRFAGGGRIQGTPFGPVHIVEFSTAEETMARRGRAFLQHTGGQVSSREAEAWLIREGVLPEPTSELRDKAATVDSVLRPWSSRMNVDAEWIRLGRGGMNCFYAAYRGASAVMRKRGRRRWVQLGWLYVDTIRILGDMCDEDCAPIVWDRVRDVDGLATLLRPMADEIAGIVIEAPTNPLFDLPDLDALRTLADELGSLLIIDPSLVGLANVDLSAYADVTVASLTKYVAASGDVMAGIVATNPSGPYASELRDAIDGWLTPLHADDLARLAADCGAHEGWERTATATLEKVVRFLHAHPRVSSVRWAQPCVSRPWLRAPGVVLSFSLRDRAFDFYDRLAMAKGPSFGTVFSLLSPYVWLALFDLTQREEGRRRLAQAEVPIDLMRLSVGHEDSRDILDTLERALA